MVGVIADSGFLKRNRVSVSWAFAGLFQLISSPMTMESDQVVLLGSAHLLGLLIDRAWEEKAKRAEDELRKMRLIRAEDAKANEKVVAIFASHEQGWLTERRNLRLQIQALATQLKSVTSKNEEVVSDLNYRITEAECALRFKEEALEEETTMRRGLEEKLELSEKRVEELSKHEAMLMELETEMTRVLEQGEMARRELQEMIESKEEAVSMAKKLSDETARVQSDSEQKDRILSALLRKSKLDADEKQMLLKEVKMAKAKKKQAELEMEKWRSKWEAKHKKGSRSSYSLEAGSSQEKKEELQAKYLESEEKGEKGNSAIRRMDHHITSDEINDELGMIYVKIEFDFNKFYKYFDLNQVYAISTVLAI